MPSVAPVRISAAPIVAAGSVQGYGPIFNAGVIRHEGVFHLFARGVRDGYRRNDGLGPRFLDYVSDVLVFTSLDGRTYAFQQVLAESSPDDVHTYEDPRVQLVRSGGEERIVMSYTNLPPLSRAGPGGSASTGSGSKTAGSSSTARRVAWSGRTGSRTRTRSSSTFATGGSR